MKGADHGSSGPTCHRLLSDWGCRSLVTLSSHPPTPAAISPKAEVASDVRLTAEFGQFYEDAERMVRERGQQENRPAARTCVVECE